MNLSVVITAHNEAAEIADCLKSVEKLANEIILVDNQSTDDTVTIAQKFGAKIYSHKNDPLHLNVSKNFGFTKAKGDWILSLDADERVSPELAHEIRQIIKGVALRSQGHPLRGYKFPRKNIIFGQWIKHGLWYPDEQIRLFQNGRAKFPGVHNHEKLQVDSDIGQLSGHLIHYNYRTVSQYIRKINDVYSDNEVDNFLKSGKTVDWYDAIRMPFSDFLTNFFARESYKDGLHGLVLSLLQAFYTFVVFAKIWEKQNFPAYNSEKFLYQVNQELRAKAKEYNYWYNRRGSSRLHRLIKYLRTPKA
jgi:glycosyltransferase involved in cell wall biosynthesis